MTTITKDFDEGIFLQPTKKGWHLTESEISLPVHLRVEIEGTSRADWNITQIWFVDIGPVKDPKTNRYPIVLVPLEGECFDSAVHFLTHSDKLLDDIQDKVNQEIIPDVSGPWPSETYCGGV